MVVNTMQQSNEIKFIKKKIIKIESYTDPAPIGSILKYVKSENDNVIRLYNDSFTGINTRFETFDEVKQTMLQHGFEIYID